MKMDGKIVLGKTLWASLFLFLFFVVGAFAQKEIKVDTGTLANAGYKIIIPDNWNQSLILYAHGYEFMGSRPRQSENPDFEVRMRPFWERGYAVAASDYSVQGYSIPQGVDETEALRKYFIARYGTPQQTIMAGTSMGGGITLAMIENYPDGYDGALAMCPFASRAYLQVRKEFDLMAVFNAFFPDVMPPLSNIMDPKVPYQALPFSEIGAKVQVIQEALAKDSIAARQLASRFFLKASDLPFSLIFNENVLRDIAQKAGGNPFDNTNTVYSGFPNDFELNKKIERLPATVEEDYLFGKYDRSGKIGKPVVLLHTVYDQLIPPQFGVVNFDNQVHQQNREHLLSVKYTNGQGHCQFTPEQIGKAFEELQAWLKTGVKVKAGALE